MGLFNHVLGFKTRKASLRVTNKKTPRRGPWLKIEGFFQPGDGGQLT